MGAFVRGGLATVALVNDARAQIALTNLRQLLNSAVASGELVSGKQWELNTDEWGASSSNEFYSAPGAVGYYSNPAGYSADQTPVMSGAATPSGAASATSEYSALYAAWKAFDKSTVTLWQTGNAVTAAAIEYDFSVSKIIARYTVSAASTYATNAPKDWTFEGWNGASWVVLDTQINQTAWSANEKRTYTFANLVGYTKFRLNIASSNSSNLIVGEIEMMELITSANIILIPPVSVQVGAIPVNVVCIFLYKDDSGSAVIGTDLTVDLSRDNGTTYTAATLDNLASYDGTYTVIKARADVSAQPAGASLLCRIKTLNGKVQRIAAPAIYAE